MMQTISNKVSFTSETTRVSRPLVNKRITNGTRKSCRNNNINLRERRFQIIQNAAVDAATATTEEIKGDIVKPSVFNTPLVRGLSLALVLAALGRGTGFLSSSWLAFSNITAYGLWIGSMYLQTFVAGLTMFKNMPRQMFGKVQSKIFPKYFTGIMVFNVIIMGTMIFGYNLPLNSQPLIVLMVALFSNLINWVAIEPKATEVLMQRYELEGSPEGRKDKEKIQALYKEFSKLHGLSSLFNLVSLGTVISHGWWIAKNLVVA